MVPGLGYALCTLSLNLHKDPDWNLGLREGN